MKMKFRAAGLLVSQLALTAWGWWGGGHEILTSASVKALPPGVPAFFREAHGAIAELAVDPDLARNKATPQLEAGESPDHFLDLELLKGSPLPADRYAMVALCGRLDVAPEKVGMLPYALTEWMQRLTIAFAEHRAQPSSESVRMKCIVSAGFMAHYAQDACQPLHLTIHYNGRVGKDGKSTKSGIHGKVDALVERLGMVPDSLARYQKPQVFIDPAGAIEERVLKSNAMVDQVYELEKSLPDSSGVPASAAVVEFAGARAREAVRFTASLYLTAWQMSEKVELPNWLQH